MIANQFIRLFDAWPLWEVITVNAAALLLSTALCLWLGVRFYKKKNEDWEIRTLITTIFITALVITPAMSFIIHELLGETAILPTILAIAIFTTLWQLATRMTLQGIIKANGWREHVKTLADNVLTDKKDFYE